MIYPGNRKRIERCSGSSSNVRQPSTGIGPEGVKAYGMKAHRKDEKQTHEQGYVIITVAILLTVLVGFMAFAVDSGFLYDSRTGAQSVADAAALAGAFTFITNPTSPQPVTAIEHATAVATDQAVMGDAVVPAGVNVTVDVDTHRVTVDLTYTEQTFFSRALGFNSADIGVQAVAEAGSGAIGGACIKPWFLPNTILSDLTPCEACGFDEDGLPIPGFEPEVLFDANGNLTDWAVAELASGQDVERRIKPGNPQDSIAPGVFSAVRFPDNSGGNDYREDIATCAGVVNCGDIFSIEPGNMIGPTAQGVRELIGGNPDVWQAPGEYLPGGSGPAVNTSRQLIVAPVWDTCTMDGFCPGNSFPGGSNTQVEVVGFSMIFLDGLQGNDVRSHIFWAAGCGDLAVGEISDEEASASPYAVPLRLIRTEGGE